MLNALQKLNPLQVYYYLRHVQLLQSPAVFTKPRSFLFAIFKKQYNTYKGKIEPRMPSALPIDIVVPVVEKDLAVLPYVLQAAKKHIKHPVGKIYVVAPDISLIRAAAVAQQAVFVNETQLCSISKHEINFVINGRDRSGWVYQQLLKLNLHKLQGARHVLVIDADTVFVKDVTFEDGGRFYFDFSDEYNVPYYKSYELLTGRKHTSEVSYVAHYMLFDKTRLQEMKEAIVRTTGKESAERAIIDLKNDVKDNSYFSEFETYANYCISEYPQQYRLRYWHNMLKPANEVINAAQLATAKPEEVKSISFHTYV